MEGIVLSDIKNIERINEALQGDYHKLQYFLSDSNGDAHGLIDHVAREVSRSMSLRMLTGLLIDETGWVKKGNKSAGVSHQYYGNVGKVANSQGAVFRCFRYNEYASFVDSRLYLPESWCSDSERCDEAGIPETERGFKTKKILALEIIKHQLSLGVSFDYIGADGFYGNDAGFASSIDDLGLIYVLDIHSDQIIFLEQPELILPERMHVKGQTPKRLKISTPGLKVSSYISNLDRSAWKTLEIRQSAKGVLKGKFHFATVFIWNKSDNRIEPRLLVVSKRKARYGEEIKYSFTNASLAQYTEQAIAAMQAQRFFIEHSFKEQKQILCMDQFQTRKWLSRYHQIALNLLVGSFLLKEKLLSKEEMPILSARDIMDFMVFKFYKEMTEDRMLAALKERHRKRLKDIYRYYSNS